MEVRDLARETSWRERVKAALAGHRLASLLRQRADLACDMRELLRAALNDPGIVDTRWFDRRAHRALCQDDGIINRGEDYIRQFRWKVDDGWSEWTLLTDESWANKPEKEIHVRWAAAGAPFEEWSQPR